ARPSRGPPRRAPAAALRWFPRVRSARPGAVAPWARPPRSPPRRPEALRQSLVQVLRRGGVVQRRAVPQRQHAASLEHPVLEAEREPLAEVHRVGGDACRIGLELVVPLGGEEHLVAAAQETGAREALHLARLHEQRAAVLARPDALGAQPAAHGGLLSG